MANLFDVNFNSNPGTPFGFTSVNDSTSGLSVAAGAALAGTAYGLNCNINDTTLFYGACVLGSGNTSGVLEVSFYFDPNSLTMANNDELYLFRAFNSSSGAIANVRLLYTTAAGYRIRASAVNDLGSETGCTTSPYPITDAPHWIEIQLVKASTADANDGILKLWIDDTLKETITTVDNNGKFSNFYSSRFGTTAPPAGTSGDFFLDQLIINDDSGFIGPVLLTVSKSEGVTLAEAVTVSIEAGPSGDLSVNKSEGVTLGESVSASIAATTTLAVDASDGITLGEATNVSVAATTTLAVDVSDGIALGESSNISIAATTTPAVNVSDGITLGEAATVSVAATATLAVSISDGVSIGDSSNVSISAIGEIDIAVSDGIAIGEAIGARTGDPQVSVSDGLVTGEASNVSIAATSTLAINVTDGITLGENVSVSVQPTATLSITTEDGVTLGEASTVSIAATTTPAVDVSDGIALGEASNVSVAATTTLVVSVNDGATVGESSNVSIGGIGEIDISVSDGIAIGEASGVSISDPQISVSDGMTIDDVVISAVEVAGVGLVNTHATESSLATNAIESPFATHSRRL